MAVSAQPKLSEVRTEIRGVSYTGPFSLSEALAEAGFAVDGSLSLFVNYVHVLSVPVITFPLNEDTVGSGSDPVTMTWDAVIGATHYDWELREGFNGSGLLADSGTVYTNSLYWIEANELEAIIGVDGSIRLKAKDATRESDWSAWRNFYVI